MLRLAVALALLVPAGADAAGTPIGDGFVTVDGTRLVARAVPIGLGSRAGEIDQGWIAMLELDGDPEEVVEAFLDQAAAAGLVPVTEMRFAGVPGRGPGAARCAITAPALHQCQATARSASGKAPRSLTINTVRGRWFGEDVSSVELRYSTTYLYWRYSGGWVFGIRVRSAPEPKPPYDPPSPGEPFGGGWPQLAGLVVQQGSTVAGRPMPAVHCSNGGTYAVVRIDGVAREVFDAYEAQALDLLREEVPFRFATSVPGGVLRTSSISQAGGDSIVLDLFEADDGEPVLRIESCHD